jgi:hypothetical protein
VKGYGRGIFLGAIPALALKNRKKPQKKSG